MPPDRRLEDLFHQAASMAALEQAALVAQLRASDPALADQLRAMLAADRRPDTDELLADPIQAEFAASAVRAASPKRGATPEAAVTVGPYRLLERIGEGGFGIVFLAERRDPFTQRVALKVLKPGMDSAAIVARFDQERQALALMDHPSVARVLDGGLTESGSPLGSHQPYFVMELVQGPSITTYCDRHRLGIRERLELFLAVCDAVLHAHMKGIIHRDLKPSNILIAEVGAKPVPKVIDFGIAKAIAGSLTDHTLYTERGQLIGTPEYMAPEQAAITEHGPADIDTRADVYSLGVLLYELLTGSLPFETGELRRGGLLEVLRIIREVEPPKPSTRVSDVGRMSAKGKTGRPALSREVLGSIEPPQTGLPTASLRIAASSTPPATSANRLSTMGGAEAATLARALRGDLDWIVMRAMDKIRSRRYDSPGSLAADIRRHLADEPVLAGPPSAGYRLAKFVRRRRGLVVAAAACLLAITGGLAASLLALREASRQRDVAVVAQAGERSERIRAEAAARFITDSIASADSRARTTDMTVTDLLDQMSSELDRLEETDPEGGLSRRILVADAYRNLERLEPAEAQLREALRRCQTSPTSRSRSCLTARLLLAQVYRATQRTDEAIGMLDELERTSPAMEVDYPELMIDALMARALLLGQKSDLAGAELAARRAVNLASHRFGDEHLDTADTLNTLAMVIGELPQGAREALSLHQRALEIRSRLAGAESVQSIRSLVNLGHVHERLGEYSAAEAAYRRALASAARRKYTPPRTLSQAQQSLAVVLRGLGKPDEARSLTEQALSSRREFAPGSPEVVESLDLLGGLAVDRGDHAAAVELYRESVATMRAWPSPSLPRLAASLTGLGGALVHLGRFVEAEAAAREALQIRRGLQVRTWTIYASQSVLGSALAGQGRIAEAEPLIMEAGDNVFAEADLGPSRKRPVIARVVAFLEQSGDQDRLAVWRERLASLTNPPAPR